MFSRGCRLAALIAMVIAASSVWAATGAATPGVPAQAQEQPPVQRATPPLADVIRQVNTTGLRKAPKIDSKLDELYRLDLVGRVLADRPVTAATVPSLTPDIAASAAAHQLRVDGAGQVQVWVDTSGAPGTTRGDLARLGMRVQRSDDAHGIIQGLLPIARLQDAAALASVAAVRLPDYPVVATGSKLTEGDAILGGAALRSQMAVSGQGVRVGVISSGLEGLATAQASSDLGTVDFTTCNEAPGAASPTATGADGEGTAMLEIVHDIAPNAQLFFGYFGLGIGGTALDFNAAVTCLAQHTDVVVDDIGFFNAGPYDGTSLVSQNTSDAYNAGSSPIRGYYTSTANEARQHYHATWSDSGVATSGTGQDFWELQRFQASSTTTDGGLGGQCSATILCGDTVEVAAGGTFSVTLEWNDPFGTSTNDYDLLVQDVNAGTVSIQSPNRQPSFPFPVESFSVTNNTVVTNAYFIFIGNYKNLAAPVTFDMYVTQCTGCLVFNTGQPAPNDFSLHNFNTISHSVPNQSDAGGGVLSVGAINAADPGNDSIEGYSSRGPTADSRTKPDISAIDCVQVTGAGGFGSPFCGTSAAAPHVAGIAALLLSCNPTLLQGNANAVSTTVARDTLRTALLNGAVSLGTGHPNNTFGFGRVSTLASAPLAGCTDTDADTIPAALDNCPTVANQAQTNTDVTVNPPGDALGDACDPDDDNDFCPDAKETGPNHHLGGQRDPLDPWDFFDVTGDGSIDLDDTIAVLLHFGQVPGGPGYSALFDRFVPNDAEPWKTAAATDGSGIDLEDAIASLRSFGDDCN